MNVLRERHTHKLKLHHNADLFVFSFAYKAGPPSAQTLVNH